MKVFDADLANVTVRASFDADKSLRVLFVKRGVVVAGLEFIPESARKMAKIFDAAVTAIALDECHEYDLRSFCVEQILEER